MKSGQNVKWLIIKLVKIMSGKNVKCCQCKVGKLKNAQSVM